ncbi:T9SS type A sorting domain-containing protein [Lutibacter sp. TH_r2]|uniref:T9SS type A sorting domain-containing protein n=1 Tax=Lutibacter sp. TH_r2 TaxID=3082083 RepID=UPI0029548A6A|nr:T9SS type A sorting domain-containing protein [Lutibacter sp. TH_r2]MDV7186497.1 T9SS type A sorting domain-containing protein [Lutibacter sp. TH_r2]
MKHFYFLCLTILISVASFGQEMLLNGNFESWDDSTSPTNWTKVENITQESATANIHGGTYSAKHVGGTKDLGQSITSITAGANYTITLWYKVIESDGDDARIWSYWKDSSGDNIDNNDYDSEDAIRGPNNSYFDNNGGVWSEYTATITAPANAAEFYFELRTYSGAMVYWDDLSFFKEESSEITLTLQDGPVSGTVDTTSPEETQQELQFEVTNFTVAAPSAGDGYIVWEVIDNSNGDIVYDSGEEQDLSDPVQLLELVQGDTYTLNAKLVDNTGADLDPAVEYTLTSTVEAYTQVADLATLRAGEIGKYYEVTSEVIAVWAQDYDHQKWAKDATAGIIITDYDEVIATIYNEGDGITGVKGQLDDHYGLLQLLPTVDPGTATSTGNPVEAQLLTIADLIADHEPYESELVEIADVVFEDADGTTVFENFKNYNITDPSSETPIAFSTYVIKFADYDGEIIPSGSQTIKALVGEYNGAVQIASRNMTTDLILSVSENNIEGFGMYPNPVLNGEFRITTASSVAKQVYIYNMLGKQVYSKMVSSNQSVNVANLTTGIYFVKVIQEGKTATVKLVVK